MRRIDLAQGSDEWLSFRRTRVTSSKIAAIMDASPYETGFEAWSRDLGFLPPMREHEGMRRGHKVEDEVREWLNDHMGAEFVPMVAVDDCQPRLAASFDAICTQSRKAVEIKSVSESVYEKLIVSEIPHHWWLQIQWQMMIAPSDYIFSLAIRSQKKGEARTHVRAVEPDEAIQAVMRREALRYLEYLDTVTEWPMTDRDVHQSNAMSAEEVTRYHELQAMAKQAKEGMDELRACVGERMTHTKEQSAGARLSWVERQGVVDYDAMLSDLQRLYGISDKHLDKDNYRKASSRYLKITI